MSRTLRSLSSWSAGTPSAGGGVVEAHLAAGVQERHQREQPGDLVLGAAGAGRAAPPAAAAAGLTGHRQRGPQAVHDLLAQRPRAPRRTRRRRSRAARRPGRRRLRVTTSRSQAVRSSGPGDVALDALGVAAQRVPGAPAHQHDAPARWRAPAPAGGRSRGRRSRRDVVRRRASRPGAPRPATRESRKTRSAPRSVSKPDGVPAPGVAHDPPRLQVPGGGAPARRSGGTRTRPAAAPGWPPRRRRTTARRR